MRLLEYSKIEKILNDQGVTDPMLASALYRLLEELSKDEEFKKEIFKDNK